MRTKLITGAILALGLTTSAMAGGVPKNPITGAPGNSSAARGEFPNSQANCLGAIISTLRKDDRGPADRGEPGSRPEVNGQVFFVGSIAGLIGVACEDLVSDQ